MPENFVFNLPLQQKQVFLVYDDLLYRIDAPIIFLGRHPTNNFILNSPRISRFHARIKFENGGFSLYDFGSKFGTFVNGSQVKVQQLHSGDRIRLADEEVTFYMGAEKIQRFSKKPTGELQQIHLKHAGLNVAKTHR